MFISASKLTMIGWPAVLTITRRDALERAVDAR
jgi:hypothetical protein